MKTQLTQTEKSPIGKRMRGMAKVEIGKTEISNSNYIPIVSSTNEYKMDEEHIILKPLTHFNYHSDTQSYVLNINVHLGDGYTIDENNAVECLCTGKNILVFLNYSKSSDAGNKPTCIFNYRIEFDSDKVQKIKGKEILVITSSGDPEEGDASKVIIEDEDEI